MTSASPSSAFLHENLRSIRAKVNEVDLKSLIRSVRVRRGCQNRILETHNGGDLGGIRKQSSNNNVCG